MVLFGCVALVDANRVDPQTCWSVVDCIADRNNRVQGVPQVLADLDCDAVDSDCLPGALGVAPGVRQSDVIRGGVRESTVCQGSFDTAVLASLDFEEADGIC